MVVLKKIKGSTLMETMVATVLIVVLFMMSSLLLNTIFASSVSGDKQNINTHLEQLAYRYKTGNLALPHYEEKEEWNIAVASENNGSNTYVVLEATNTKTKQQLKTYTRLAE